VSNFSYRGIREESEQAFFPFQREAAATFYVRVRGSGGSSFEALRAIVRGVDPALPMTNFRTLDEQVDRSLNTEHMLATLSGSFGVLALLLSLVGLYGVMSFVVTQRTREIGIRLALGARRWSAIWLVLHDALAMVLCGIGIGLPVVWALGRLVESQLYGVKPFDVTAIAISILVLGAAGLGAAFVPARRASGVNPTDALRVD
jgi:ABC-type antimicrobial peptide transport system permease subunit